MRPPLDDLLDFLAERGRGVILQRYRPDSCIASTRIGIEFLRVFGYFAKPLPVKTTILNKPMLESIEEKLDEPKEGSHILAIEGTDTVSDGSWDGHLIFTIDGNLVDLSLDQATRPGKGIILEPLIGRLTESWPVEPVGFNLGEVFVGYELIENGHNWRQAGDWKRRTRWSPIVSQLVREWRVKSSEAS